MKSMRSSIVDLLSEYFEKDMDDSVGSFYQKNKKINISISHWGAERFWTPCLLLKIMKLGLKLSHFESPEQNVVMGVFVRK